MGKDRDGTFHPGKGKPSGANKEEGLGAQATPPEKMNEYNEMTEKYTSGPDELAPNVHLLHPNRNTSKANTSRGYGTKTSGKPDHEKEQDDNARNRVPAAQTAAAPLGNCTVCLRKTTSVTWLPSPGNIVYQFTFPHMNPVKQ